MRIIKVSFLAILLFTASRSSAGQSDAHPDKASVKKMSISGTVGSACRTLVSDKGGHVWKVANPEALTTNEGMHVIVKALLNREANEIVVSTVHLQEIRSSAATSDSAFRR